MSMVKTEHLKFRYSKQKEFSFPDINLGSGDQCLLLGESGSGKTTLLHLLGGLLSPESGSVSINGTLLGQLSGAALDKFRGANMGFIFQKNHLITALDVRQNLHLALYLAQSASDQHTENELLKTLGMEGTAKSRISELSQGQAQRVAIARAMITRPRLILADEPTSALDDTNCERVARLLLQASEQIQSTLIIATHDQRLREFIPKSIKL